MIIKEIYEKFEGAEGITFATIRDNYPETRIAKFYAYDQDGLYFCTTYPKPFYSQLMETKRVSACGKMGTSTLGYSIRVTGDVEEIPIEKIKDKYDHNPLFEKLILEADTYRGTRVFLLKNGGGEVYDFDFEMKNRDHKLLRTPFNFNHANYKNHSLNITFKCIGCKKCIRKCSFKAIDVINKMPTIDASKCNLCGDCLNVCQNNAIKIKV